MFTELIILRVVSNSYHQPPRYLLVFGTLVEVSLTSCDVVALRALEVTNLMANTCDNIIPNFCEETLNFTAHLRGRIFINKCPNETLKLIIRLLL